MKATFEFDLPEETRDHLRHTKSLDMAIVLFELSYNFWREFRDADEELIDKIRSKIFDLFEQHGINIDELIE